MVRVIEGREVLLWLTWQAHINAFPGGSNYTVGHLRFVRVTIVVIRCDLRRITNDIIPPEQRQGQTDLAHALHEVS